MRLAVASGKGGTGKTTVAVNLALAANRPVLLLDCDVEEPNAHLFLKAVDPRQRTVSLPIPEVDESKCDGCGDCSRFCRFNAIVSFGTAPYISRELCHSCGGCILVCPKKALHETQHRVGTITCARRAHVTLIEGRLDVGVVWIPPMIRAVKEEGQGQDLVIVDAPPGTACPVAASLSGSNYVLLVTEPTPFGLNDLGLAVDVVRELKIPFGVVINRADIGDDRVRLYCRREGIAVLAEIPNDRRIAEAYSRGEAMIEALPEYRDLFSRLLDQISGRAAS
jgi:MinD superfamily P-loop ATPase